MDPIYHIATAADWEQASRDGEYTISTRGQTLAEQGFIHCSGPGQVAGVANFVYRGVPELVLLVIDPSRVRSRIQYDAVPDEPAPYPHIYGPLNADAVVEVRPFEPAPDGTFTFDG
jgi:glutathione S-transferase